MAGFNLGPYRLAGSWRPLLHPAVRELRLGDAPDPACDDCPMVRQGFFEPHIKCCGYTPPLPSFLVGEVLVEGQAPGSPQTVRDWITAGRADPLFVNVPPRIVQMHREQRAPCPLHAGGGCTIYEQRPYLCIHYSCVQPEDPNARAFLYCLASLLELLSSAAPQMLAAELGIDRERYSAAWEAYDDEAQAWTTDDRLRADLASQLWQGNEPEEYYRRCFELIAADTGDIHERLERFRRGQLIRRLETAGAAGQERAAEISALPYEVAVRDPSAATAQTFAEGPVRFAANPWTLYEHQSLLLWFQRRWARQNPDGQPRLFEIRQQQRHRGGTK